MADKDQERYEGVDADFLTKDTWAKKAETITCPQCGFGVEAPAIRCPRCNALVIAACSGACGACVSRTCVRRCPGE